MARVSTYLNFLGNTEEAFSFYRTVFGGDFSALVRMDNMPVSDEDKSKIMHVCLPILGDHQLMGTDMLESMGHVLERGNNVSIMIEPDSLDDAVRLHAALGDGGSDIVAVSEAPWGGHYGSCVDRFGIRWMFNIA